jgi:hypothetical protein
MEGPSEGLTDRVGICALAAGSESTMSIADASATNVVNDSEKHEDLDEEDPPLDEISDLLGSDSSTSSSEAAPLCGNVFVGDNRPLMECSVTGVCICESITSLL